MQSCHNSSLLCIKAKLLPNVKEPSFCRQLYFPTQIDPISFGYLLTGLKQTILTNFVMGSITVRLTYCLIPLDLTKQVNLVFMQHSKAAETKQIKEVIHTVILTLMRQVSECSLVEAWLMQNISWKRAFVLKTPVERLVLPLNKFVRNKSRNEKRRIQFKQ